MKPVTHYEVYQVKAGRWSLRRRHASGEQDRALEFARELEAEGSPVQIIEERLEPETNKVSLRVVARLGKASAAAKGPPEDGDVITRILMVALNAFGIGLIAAALTAMLLSPLRDAATRSTYNMLMFFIFAAAALTAGLSLFKVYVPMDLILWRAKTQVSRERVAELLTSGADRKGEDASRPRAAAFKNESRAAPPAEFETAAPPPTQAPPPLVPATPAAAASAPRLETNADQGEQTSFHFAPQAESDAASPAPGDANAAPAAAPDPPAEPLSAEALAAQTALFLFVDSAVGLMALSRPNIQAFERFGLNLYFAGAVRACATLPPEIAPATLTAALMRAGTSQAAAESFAARLEAALSRPRFKALIDAGAEAFVAAPDENGQPRHERLAELLREWSDPTARGARTETVTFLLTDIVGSTKLTAEIGNSGAQRVVRAHNMIVRTAAKDFRGREVKHTGDGILLAFVDPASAARAAMDIQEEAFAYARDNAEAPLSLRIGLHCGSVSTEDGEYYGEVVLLIDGICAAGQGGEIACSEEIAARVTGPAFRFVDIGPRLLKGTEIERKLFTLAWAPRSEAPESRIEYRQIGTAHAGQGAS